MKQCLIGVVIALALMWLSGFCGGWIARLIYDTPAPLTAADRIPAPSQEVRSE